MFASSNKKSKKSRMSSDPTDAEPIPEPIDILVDSIIGLLEQSMAYLRAVANQAFSLLSSTVQETTVNLILTVSSCAFLCYYWSCHSLLSATGTPQPCRAVGDR